MSKTAPGTAILVGLVACAAPRADRAGVDTFNHALETATRTIDNAATIALWEDDAASFLPETPGVEGKAAFKTLLDEITSQHPAAHMTSFELRCDHVEVAGDRADEVCTEHQIVDLGSGASFDGKGRMLLVLHRGGDGVWRLRREMWQPLK